MISLSKETYALIGIGLMMCSRGSYIASILKGRTRPHSFSWFIWGVISTIGFAAQYAEDTGPACWVRGFGAATCFLLVVMGWFKGERDIRRADLVTLIVALLAIPLWVATKTPLWSVILVCLIDTIGYFPTIRKSWHKPRQETYVGYILSCLAAFFSLLAIENYTPVTWLYPVVLVISNGSMAVFLLARRAMTSSNQAVAA